MSTVNRSNRKVHDADLIRLNTVGISLGAMGRLLGCEAATVALRLRQLGLNPTDTRRAFMEDIYDSMTPDQRDWLIDQLGPHSPIKSFIKDLLINAYVAAQSGDRPDVNFAE